MIKPKLLVLWFLAIMGWAVWGYTLNLSLRECDIANRNACIATVNGGDEAVVAQQAIENNKGVVTTAYTCVGVMLFIVTVSLVGSSSKNETKKEEVC
jgi:hypothetical protein